MKKVMASESGQTELLGLPVGKRFEALVSARKPFGLDTSFKGKTVRGSSDLVVYRNGGRGYTPRSGITAGGTLVDKWKIFIGYAAPGTGNRDTYPHRVISTPFVGEPGSCLLYTSAAAAQRSSVDLGGRRTIKKKKKTTHPNRRKSRQQKDHRMKPM